VLFSAADLVQLGPPNSEIHHHNWGPKKCDNWNKRQKAFGEGCTEWPRSQGTPHTLHTPPPIAAHSEAEPGSFSAFVTDRQTDWQKDAANIGKNRLHLMHSMQPKNGYVTLTQPPVDRLRSNFIKWYSVAPGKMRNCQNPRRIESKMADDTHIFNTRPPISFERLKVERLQIWRAHRLKV